MCPKCIEVLLSFIFSLSQSSLMKIARERTYDLDINKEEPYARDEEQKYLQAALASPTARAAESRTTSRGSPLLHHHRSARPS